MLIISVDGRNLAPPDMYETLVNNGIFTISTGAGVFSPLTVVFHSDIDSDDGGDGWWIDNDIDKDE